MMKKLSVCVAVLCAVTAHHAMAERGAFYAEGKFGGSRGDSGTFEVDIADTALEPSDFNENVYVWGAAVGYTYKPWAAPLRMEIEYLYRNHYPYSTDIVGDGGTPGSTLHGHTNTQTILANFYLDIPLSRMFAVFIGGGVGEAISRTHSTVTVPGIGTFSDTADDAGFSWMGTAGFSVMPIQWLGLNLSYRYSGLNSITSRAGTTIDSNNFNAQEILLGVRVMIPDLYPGARKPRPVPMYTAPEPLDK